MFAACARGGIGAPVPGGDEGGAHEALADAHAARAGLGWTLIVAIATRVVRTASIPSDSRQVLPMAA